MGKIPSSDPDWLLEFPLFTSSARNLENARMTVHPRPPATHQLWFSPGCKESSCINPHVLSKHKNENLFVYFFV